MAGGLSYTQNFGYDALNRLTTSNENSGSSWSQTNGYDQYGNRWIDYGGGVHNLSFSSTTNRITTSGYTHDAAGNLTNDSIHSYGFDAENKIKTVDGVSGVYGYDGDGNRVRKNFALGEQVRMVYSGGQLIAEYDISNGSLKKEYIYAAKGLVATVEPSTGTRYTTSDHLGSPRVVTSSSGSLVSRHDYLPFCEELFAGTGGRTATQGYTGDSVRQKFTHKERDLETGLDYFGARYYASTQGRFTGVDPISGEAATPQSWNLYSYVRGNPLNSYDPDGKSTHTDKDGYVVAVYDDNDLGLYEHDSLKGWNHKDTLTTNGKGINRMGETEYWDEFREVNDKTGEVMSNVAKDARILFGQSFDQDIERLNKEANRQPLMDTAEQSKHGRRFDIKTDKNIAPDGQYTGKLLNGKYASARSAGNYLAGLNAATGYLVAKNIPFEIRTGQISEETTLKLFGAFQVQGHLSKIDAAEILTNGKAYGPPPYYGEIEYSGRRQVEGFLAGQRFRN